MAPSAIIDMHDRRMRPKQLWTPDETPECSPERRPIGEDELGLIVSAMKQHVGQIDPLDCENGEDEAFFVADLGEIYRQHMRWKRLMPRIKPLFAVKCNPDPAVLGLLQRLGAGFDCASKQEIEQVLSLGVSPYRIIYAQPCKANSHLRYAAKHKVQRMTFDNADELYKIKELAPDAELFLRIMTDDSGSLCRLSQKFGAPAEDCEELIRLAIDLGLNVVGVAFHCGSGASDPSAFVEAVRDASTVFDQAERLGVKLKVVDCGGGFASDTFDEIAPVLRDAIEEHFPSSVEVIAEPGRYYTATAFTLACNVIARRSVSIPSAGQMHQRLYLNDGLYGNLSCIMFDHQHPEAKVLPHKRQREKTGLIEYSIWGPTCDGIDCISESWKSTEPINVGDWLYFQDMGAYTKCSATRFNGFANDHQTIYVCSDPSARALLET